MPRGPRLVAHSCEPSTREAEAKGVRVHRQPGVTLWIQDYLRVQSKTPDSNQTKPSIAKHKPQTDVWVPGSGFLG